LIWLSPGWKKGVNFYENLICFRVLGVIASRTHKVRREMLNKSHIEFKEMPQGT
jgi:hypothetical protein